MSQLQKKIREPLLPEGEGGEGETANEPKDVDKGSTISLPERLEKPEPLTRQQVNQCLMDIDDFQPLKKRVKIEHICPCLQVFQRLCCRPRRPEFRQVLRAVMTEELALTPPKDKAKAAAKAKETGEQLAMLQSKTDVQKDPFLLLGYGVNAYFASMLHMAKMFAMVTLFCLPIYAVYSKNEAKAFEGGSMYALNQFTLGNLGGASVQCFTQELGNKNIDVICPRGTVLHYKNGEVLDPEGNLKKEKTPPTTKYGVIPGKSDQQNFCSPEPIKNNMCQKHIDAAFIDAQLDACSKDKKKKRECLLNFFEGGKLKVFKSTVAGDDAVEANCHAESNFFIQVACVVPYDRMQKRQLYGLAVACIGVLVYFFTIVYFDYIRAIEKNKYLDFDVATITAGDYTVEFDMPHESYEYFKKVYYDETCPMNEINQFKQYVQEELEDRFTDMPDLGFDEVEQPEIEQSFATKLSKLAMKKQKKAQKQEKQLALSGKSMLDPALNRKSEPGSTKRIKIAQITFAFFNADLINWLKARGTHITNEQWEKVSATNKEINEAIKDDEMLDRLQTPCSCFVTLETEEGYQRAKMYNKLCEDSREMKSFHQQTKEEKKKAKKNKVEGINENYLVPVYFNRFLGQKIEIEEASEPTDIIWENRQITKQYRFKQTIIVWIIIAIALTLSGCVIYVCSYTSTSLKLRYPKTDCDNTDVLYEGKDKKYEQKAFQEYLYNEDLKAKGQPTDYKTNMQCFCKKQGKENKAKVYEKVDNHGKATKVAFCAAFYKDKLNSKILGMSISFIIIGVNTILKLLIIKLIESIKHDTQSQKLASITNGVFIAQFFNTGILLLLVNANMTEHSPMVITQFISTGKYYDYYPMWYKDVGNKIVKTMIINSMMPYVALVTGFMVPKLMQRMDGKNHYVTKKTSMAKFKMLHGGKDYIIHFKYSNVLNVAYITMMYGLGMPLLFPIAMVNYLNQYFCERVIVAYCMKIPPALDDKLVRNFVRMLKWAPLLFLCNGYWMVSNPEIFRNTFSFIQYQSQSMKSLHFLVFIANRHSVPLLLMSLAHMALIVIMIVANDWMKRLGFTLGQIDIEIDEDLPNFFESLTLRQANEIVEKDQYFREHFLFEENDPDTIKRLDATVMPQKRAIQGTAWYAIYTNQDYADDFNYIGPHINEREKLIEDGYQVHQVKKKLPKKRKEVTVMSDTCRKRRWEQSDFVAVMLSLASIPDSVIRKVDFSREHWSIDLKIEMEDYQKQWMDKHAMSEWQWQTAEVETKYKEFIASQKENADDEYQKDKKEEQIHEGMKDLLKEKMQQFKKQETLQKQ